MPFTILYLFVIHSGHAKIQVLRAGICNTDLELLQGYMGFKGVLGHEFVGRVVEGSEKWLNQRVCGDINVGCADCQVCDGSFDLTDSKRSRNHCPSRQVLGILNKDGTFAEYLTLPEKNLHLVPPELSDEEAVFAEPLAAACRIVEQNLVKLSDKVAILGDGKLGLMIAEVLGRQQLETKPVLFGKHQHKLELVKDSGVDTRLVSSVSADHSYDVVVDATGSPEGLRLAASLCRPMGTLVLKSTCAAGSQGFNAAPFVIDELRVVGSRCGPINHALNLLREADPPLNVSKYITKTFPLQEVNQALQFAALKSTMKIQIVMHE